MTKEPTKPPYKKTPNPTDKHVGSRVRQRRTQLGMSQEKLGDGLGLTFQQVQKYEKGVNRIGSSRLQQIADILRVEVAWFFDGQPASSSSAVRRQNDGADMIVSDGDLQEFLANRQNLLMIANMMKISDERMRKGIRQMVATAAGAKAEL